MIQGLRESTYIAIVFIITFSLAYLLGTSVLYLIDHKMNDISINMPKINLQNSVLPKDLVYDEESGETTAYRKDIKTIPKNRKDNILTGQRSTQPKQKGGFAESYVYPGSKVKVLKQTIESFQDTVPDAVKIGPSNNKCSSNSDCNLIPGQSGNVCTIDSSCHCLTGIGPKCNRSLTYYKELTEMTPAQKLKFKKRAKLSKMTLKDYTNWLSMFKNDLDDLALNHPAHTKNFEKFLAGKQITTKDFSKAKEEVIRIASNKAIAAEEVEEVEKVEKVKEVEENKKATVEDTNNETEEKMNPMDKSIALRGNTGKGFSVFGDNNDTMYAAYPSRYQEK